MTEAAETAITARPIRRRYPRKLRRKTSEFSVLSATHQRLVLESLEQRLRTEPLRWKQARLRWMIRRLTETLEVHERNGHAR